MQLNVVYYRHSSVNVFKNSYNPKEICLKMIYLKIMSTTIAQ